MGVYLIPSKIAVIGFPKAGTMSMVEWLKKKNPGAVVSRPENIYITDNGNWSGWLNYAITRDPVKRIQSGMRYFTELRNLTVQQVIKGEGFHNERYENVGFRDCIAQSDYKRYILKFQEKWNCAVGVHKFEDLIKDKDFPHINETDYKREFTEDETNIIKDVLDRSGITY